MNDSLPLLPTSVVGSYARPGWLSSGLEAVQRGEFRPADLWEMLDDAVDLALRDQEDAGVDIVSDAEMRRAGFFTSEFYSHLTGLRPLAPDRLQGPSGHNQQHRFEVLAPVSAPEGLGVVAEYRHARQRASRPLVRTVPGPFTLAGRLMPGEIYPDRAAAAWALAPIINAELKSLVKAGATSVQIDEPSPAIRPDSPVDFVGLFNAAVEGVEARLGAHLCFGNFAGRPLGKRQYAPVLGQMMQYRVDQLVLEFANRELVEVELLGKIATERDVAIGIVDVKSYYIETFEDVAARIRKVLEHVPAERLTIVPDCGFSQTARWASRAKLHMMVEGTRIVRSELTG
jgi:5-methyltetrahydropteroyltriglutamate--homocysteine methyltransferase